MSPGPGYVLLCVDEEGDRQRGNQWDINDDGVFDDVTSSSSSVLVPWSTLNTFGIDNGGTFLVAVRITNHEGSEFASTTLTVENRTVSLSGADDITEGSQFTLNIGNLLSGEAIAFETVKAYSSAGDDRVEGDSAVDFLMLQGDWDV